MDNEDLTLSQLRNMTFNAQRMFSLGLSDNVDELVRCCKALQKELKAKGKPQEPCPNADAWALVKQQLQEDAAVEAAAEQKAAQKAAERAERHAQKAAEKAAEKARKEAEKAERQAERQAAQQAAQAAQLEREQIRKQPGTGLLPPLSSATPRASPLLSSRCRLT